MLSIDLHIAKITQKMFRKEIMNDDAYMTTKTDFNEEGLFKSFSTFSPRLCCVTRAHLP